MGVDMATYKELIAHRLDIEAIRKLIGADSLDYLSLPGLMETLRTTTGLADAHCSACFSGNYPIDIPPWLFEEDRAKLMLGEVWGT
jgi:amidophosphoribosyltransferase